MSGSHELIAGRYRPLEQVGAGGMGVVWRAHDERLGRDVAVKRLHPPRDTDEAQAELASRRAMREARITARLHHPHAVPVFDVVEHEGQPCLVMEYFPSRSLGEHLAEHGRMPSTEVARIGGEVASALAAAHHAGIVHRDVKPANVLVGPDGTSRITDFGIAHALGDASLTTTGMVTGTPAYLSPEVARGSPATPASDVFSLGSTLYAALEGRPPFGTSDNAMALLHLVASGEVVPPRHAGALAPLVLRMLAADPEARPSAGEVATALSGPLEDLAGVLAPTVVSTGPTDPTERVRPPDEGDRGETPASGDATPVPVDAGPPVGARPTPPPADPVEGPRAPEHPAAGPARHRAGLVVLVLAAAVAVLAFALPVLQDRAPDGAQPATTATGERSPSPSRSAATSSAPPTSSPVPPTSAAPEPTRTPSSPPASATPTAAQLAGAVEDYYALLPDDPDAAWSRLSERYQRTTATNRRTFGAFWGDVERVRTSDVNGSPPGAVTATITYEFDDGRVFVERTAYSLVADDGVLEIDRSTVLSSVQR